MPDELVFREEDHKYFLNGKEIPSVSELTRFLSKEVYGEADPIALERAAEKGTAVHNALQTLDEKGEVEVDSEYDGYIAAYLNFREEHDVEWREIEWMVHSLVSILLLASSLSVWTQKETTRLKKGRR